MRNDPFLTLLVEALNLMHPRFAAARPVHEFYHQFRRLWDKALPVQLGLGHIVVQTDSEAPPGPQPDLLIWQLGEHGNPDRRLGAISVIADKTDAGVEVLARFKDEMNYPYAVAVGIDFEPLATEGITRIVYNNGDRSATIVG
ncbi:MAG TPA: hypothetical protein VN641_03150 [Urbifossiella sp.]|nr:hypothetical protein [Urbifossiella sp.]